MQRWKQGQKARLEYAGRQVDAKVILASANGRSLFLVFDGMAGGWLGGIPLLLKGSQWECLHGLPAELTQLEEQESCS